MRQHPMPHKVDLNLLRTFAVVYQCGSVTKASEKLDITQSAVSNSINRLKTATGQELFNRTGRGVTPTRFAQHLYERLQSPLLELEGLVESFTEFDDVQTHKFVVYCHEVIFHSLRQSLDQELAGSKIEILLIEMPLDEERIYDALSNEQIDLLIGISCPEGAMFTSSVVRQDQLCCIVKNGHPRINESTLNKTTYLQEHHAFFDLTRFDLKFVDWITDEVLPQRQAYSEHKSLMGMIEAVSYSEAIGVVPLSIAKRYQAAFNLTLLPFPFSNHTFDSYMTSLTKMQSNQANTWLRETISRVI